MADQPTLYVVFSDDGNGIRMWSRDRPDLIEQATGVKPTPFFAGPQPAFCCCACGMPDVKTGTEVSGG